tara:strand:- start:329 stop:493 length:165 start_codon:yes stop_codon:yes gene_type:complete
MKNSEADRLDSKIEANRQLAIEALELALYSIANEAIQRILILENIKNYAARPTN